jgi:TetR/AcrR family transcriptional repressor of mexJK operon
VLDLFDAVPGHAADPDERRASRVTKRTVYTYSGDKTEVFTAAIERFRARDLANLESAADALLDVAARLVYVLHSDDAVGLHRLMIGEAAQFPELAALFYASGPHGYIELLAGHLRDLAAPEPNDRLAEALFGLLLGESHRRRLLGLSQAPTQAAAREHARGALAVLGIAGSVEGKCS